MPREDISITTEDGTCRTSVFTPGGPGPWPAAILCMDGLAIRPPLLAMGERLAAAGYVVAVPDLFYRGGHYEPFDPKVVLASNDFRSTIGPLMSSTDNHKAAKDIGAVIAHLDTRKDVAGQKIGTFGYCFGGGVALNAAGTFPDRIAAAASFHGGNLASDAETSPHRLAGRIKAQVYIGVADKDGSYPPEMAHKLEAALQEAEVEYVSAFYPNALHGWTQTDFPIYNEAAAERHWRDLIALFDGALK